MKVGTLLLAVFVFLLSAKSIAQPIAEEVLTDACCATEHAKDTKAHGADDEDCGGCDEHCSPFQPCCPYTAIAGVTFGLKTPKITYLVDTAYPLYNATIYSNYSSDFWQPPKVT